MPGVPRDELPALLTRAISTASNGIVIADARAVDMPLVYANAAFERMTGYRQEEVLGRNCRLLQGPATDRTMARVISRLLAGRDVHVTLLNYRRDGSPFWNEVTISPVHDDRHRLTHFIGNQVDVSDRVDRDERTAYLTSHDALTGLPNRVNVVEQLEHLEQELRRSARTGAGVAVVVMDLHRFTGVDDAYGHGVGDQALLLAAQRLRSVVRAADLVGHLGENQFVLVLTGLPAGDDEPVRRVVEHLRTALGAALDVAGRRVHLDVGIGYALSPGDGGDAARLVDMADARTYRSERAV